MRVQLTFSPQSMLVLPKSYQHNIQGFIYSLIKDEKFKHFLHNEGFGDQRKFKLYTFSMLRGAYEYNPKSHEIIFKEKFKLEISSIVPEFILQITDALLKNDTLYLNNQQIKLLQYKYIDYKVKKNKIQIEMISPLTVYQTINGKTKYVSPTDEIFEKLININLKNKFKSVYISKTDPVISIKPLKVTEKDQITAKYKNHIIICYKGVYELSGHHEILDFLYNTGLGSKNSMGFGMFRVKL